ncbi:Fe2OG dioxygenase domain-containing protein [Psidium guajava]|nr:Fe2OG dioxygenase domain-containing protein [Psidium guajava]
MSPSIATGLEEELNDAENRCQKGVKQLCADGISRVPNKYVWPVQERPVNDRPKSSEAKHISLPVIDFEELQGPNRPEALKSLANACEQYGFFQLVNHSIPREVISRMVGVSKRFFELPYNERARYMSSDMFAPVRCGTSFNQNKDKVFCWRDFLKLTCHPLSDVLPHWPSSPSDMRELAVTYAKEAKHMFLKLTEAVLESLAVRKMRDQTMSELEDGSQLMVVNCYPRCPEPELTLGMPPHSDYGFLTLLLQDQVEGLQIQHKDEWHTVQPIPNALTVNVGDHLEIFSNGRYKSVLHRVTVNSTQSRISVASLHSLPYKCTIRPSPEIIDDVVNPKRYMETDFASFLAYISSCEPKKKDFLESRKLT